MKTVTYDVTNSGVKITPVAFLKFAEKEEYLVDLIKKGKLYFSTMRTFREAQRNEGDFTNDPFDGATSYLSAENGTYKTEINGLPLEGEFKSINIASTESYNGNISCLYSITTDCFEDGKLIPVDNRMIGNYTYVLFIND